MYVKIRCTYILRTFNLDPLKVKLFVRIIYIYICACICVHTHVRLQVMNRTFGLYKKDKIVDLDLAAFCILLCQFSIIFILVSKNILVCIVVFFSLPIFIIFFHTLIKFFYPIIIFFTFVSNINNTLGPNKMKIKKNNFIYLTIFLTFSHKKH